MKKIITLIIENNLLRTLILVLSGCVLGINIYTANSISLIGDKIPMPFGYGVAVVLSGSMEPSLSKGDLIIIKEADDIKNKDIIVYQSKDELIVHRVVEIQDNNIVTKGDANVVIDEPIMKEQIKGEVIFSLNGIGNVVLFFKSPVGIVITLLTAFLLVEGPRVVEERKNRKIREDIIKEIEELRHNR